MGLKDHQMWVVSNITMVH